MHDCGEAELEHNKNDEFNQLKKSRALHLLSFRFPCFCTKFTFFVHLGRVGYFCSKLTCYEPRNRRLRVNNGLMTKVVPATCADTQGIHIHIHTYTHTHVVENDKGKANHRTPKHLEEACSEHS